MFDCTQLSVSVYDAVMHNLLAIIDHDRYKSEKSQLQLRCHPNKHSIKDKGCMGICTLVCTLGKCQIDYNRCKIHCTMGICIGKTVIINMFTFV